MAKVTGPLFSLTASGKLANAMVHFSWKGINCVRSWVMPKNAKTEDQGDIRLILGGLGRSTRVIGIDSPYHVDAVKIAGPKQTFVSAFVKYIMDNVMKDKTAFEAELLEYTSHTAKSDFDDVADDLGLADFDVSYKGATGVFAGGLMVYELAKYAISRRGASAGAFDRDPYTTALASWTDTELGLMVTDLETPTP